MMVQPWDAMPKQVFGSFANPSCWLVPRNKCDKIRGGGCWEVVVPKRLHPIDRDHPDLLNAKKKLAEARMRQKLAYAGCKSGKSADYYNQAVKDEKYWTSVVNTLTNKYLPQAEKKAKEEHKSEVEEKRGWLDQLNPFKQAGGFVKTLTVAALVGGSILVYIGYKTRKTVAKVGKTLL